MFDTEESGFFGRIFATKDIVHAPQRVGLKRDLNLFDLITYGIGAIIGAGIFVLTGVAAAERAGPGLCLSVLFDGIACIFSALCYAEFASMIPSSGSAYTYTYVAIGELPAWLVGWALMLEYILGASTVARGWSGYLISFFAGFGIELPVAFIQIPITNDIVIDFLAGAVVIVLTLVIISGTKKTANLNSIVTLTSIIIVLFVIFAGIPFVEVTNWSNDFLPYGVAGIFGGSATMFFAFIGFDSVANLSEEVKKAKRDIPLGIILSLIICTILYFAVSLIITGMVPYNEIDVTAPLSAAFEQNNLKWAGIIISIGAFAGLTTTIITLLSSIPRTVFSMGRDGLLPQFLSYVNPKTHTPIWAIALCASIAFFLALLLDIELLAELVSIGTLSAFTLVCFGVLTLRFRPNMDTPGITPFERHIATLTLFFAIGVMLSVFLLLKGFPIYISAISLCVPGAAAILLVWQPGQGLINYRQHSSPEAQKFTVPLMPFLPLLGIAANIVMIMNLRAITFIGFGIWTGIGIVIYFMYGFFHSQSIPENRALLARSASLEGDPMFSADDDLVVRSRFT